MYKILQHYSFTITILTQLIYFPKSLIFFSLKIAKYLHLSRLA